MSEYVYPHIDPSDDTQVRGLELRDYFAVKAMAAMVNAAPSGTGFGVNHQETNLNYALASYAMADAMLQARNES